MDQRERLAFAAEFANMSIESLRKGERIDLAEDIEVFIGIRKDKGKPILTNDMGGVIPTPDKAGPITEADLKILRTQTHSILKAYIDSRTGVAEFYVTGKISILTIKGHPTFMIRGTLHDRWKGILILLLHTFKHAEKLRKCPEDGNFFLKVRRQIYCSRGCVDVANKRAQRSRKKK